MLKGDQTQILKLCKQWHTNILQHTLVCLCDVKGEKVIFSQLKLFLVGYFTTASVLRLHSTGWCNDFLIGMQLEGSGRRRIEVLS
jgi:hypothetical protein